MVALLIDAIKISHVFSRTGGEIAETGFWVSVGGDTGGTTQGELDTFVNSVHAAFLALWPGIDQYASPRTKPLRTRGTYYQAGSLTSDLVSEEASEIAAGTSATLHPYQCSLVASLRSQVPTRRGRGRMYWPLDGVPMSAFGQYSDGDVAIVATQLQTYLNAVNALTVGGEIVSIGVASHVSGQVLPVVQLRVDTIPDVQRRRVNQLLPVATSVLPITP